MKITREWLEEKWACKDGMEWFLAEGITEPVAGIRNLEAKGHWDWANWLIVRVMERKQCLAYAIFAAEQVIDIFDEKYPDDKRPRKAIEAAKAVLNRDTLVVRDATGDVAEAAEASGWAARDAARAAWAAWDAAEAATGYAAGAAEAAEWAARDAAWAAAEASGAAEDAMKLKILEYGISLLEKPK